MDLEEYLLAAPAELHHDLRDLMADAICGATYQIERGNTPRMPEVSSTGLPATIAGMGCGWHWTGPGGQDARTTQDQ